MKHEPNEPLVEIMGYEHSSIDYLNEVFDQTSNSYFFPQTANMLYDPGILADAVADDAIAVAFLDSGMMHNHPAIKSRLRHSEDFTGEGPEDLNGHGTMVSLMGLTVNPDMAFVSVKILDKHGRGKKSWLLNGLKWCAEHAEEYNIKVVNLSAGIYHKKWGFFDCKSDCSICMAAKALSDTGVSLVAAAGNDGPDNFPCPQKVGLMENAFLVVKAVDPLTGKTTDYSGQGNIAAPEARATRYTFRH
jgi:subtilisin family serine protease